MTSDAHTVRLHRILKAPPARVYRAFVDPAALCRWLPPAGFLATMHEHDIRVGGGYRMSFTNFGTGSSHAFRVTYLEMVEHTLIRHTDQFESEAMPEVIEVTVTFTPVACGTELRVVQANIPPQIPLEFCYLGWQESLAQLATLVEPEIPDDN